MLDGGNPYLVQVGALEHLQHIYLTIAAAVGSLAELIAAHALLVVVAVYAFRHLKLAGNGVVTHLADLFSEDVGERPLHVVRHDGVGDCLRQHLD